MKNFQLIGIAETVRFGQGGLLIKNNGTQFVFRNSSDSDYVEILSKYPTTDNSVATKEYVDDNIGGGGYTSPITLKGDIFIGSDTGTDSTLSIGANNFVLVPDSTVTGGLKWINLATHPEIINLQINISANNTNITTNTNDILNIENDILGINLVLTDHETRITNLEGASLPVLSKGSLLTNNGSGNVALAVGADTQILSADSASPTGLKWINQPSGGGSGASKVWVSTSVINDGHSNTFWTDINNATITIVSDGTPIEVYLLPRVGFVSSVSISRSGAGSLDADIRVRRGAVPISGHELRGYGGNAGNNFYKLPSSSFVFYDFAPPIGSVTYQLQITAFSVLNYVAVNDAYIAVRQINRQ